MMTDSPFHLILLNRTTGEADHTSQSTAIDFAHVSYNKYSTNCSLQLGNLTAAMWE